MDADGEVRVLPAPAITGTSMDLDAGGAPEWHPPSFLKVVGWQPGSRPAEPHQATVLGVLCAIDAHQ